MNRIVLIHNPRSSNASRVKSELLEPLKTSHSDTLAIYEISPIGFDYNVAQISKFLKPKDTVIVAGGDGTATISAGGILASHHPNIKVAFLPYGNFSDIANTFTGKITPKKLSTLLNPNTPTIKAYTLSLSLNKKFYRYIIFYLSIGLIAGAVGEINDKESRKTLKNGNIVSNFFRSSFGIAAPYYFKHKNTKKLPQFTSTHPLIPAPTDYLAINSPRLVRISIGKPLYLTHEFNRVLINVSSFPRMIPFVLKSIFRHMPKNLVKKDTLVFSAPSSLNFHSDGEDCILENIKQIDIEKSSEPLNVITLKN